MKLPQVKKLINKRNLLILGAVIILGGLFSFAVVWQVRQERADRATQNARNAEFNDLASENAQLKVEVAQLTSASQNQTARAESVCSWVRSQAPTHKLVVPSLCTVKK